MRDDGDRILRAELAGTARYHARHRPLTDQELAAGAAELRELSAGRSDLLAECAGLELGFHSPADADWTLHRTAADLLVAAGAGPQEDIARWTDIGRQRAAAARSGRAPRGH
jgi:hypothetical protein